MITSTIRILLLCMVVFCLLHGSGYTQKTDLATHVDTALMTNLSELEPLFDSLVMSALDTYHVPGAALVVVSRDSTLFMKGYGYARLDDSTPVDPERTIFRVASNSKSYTSTAVMQGVQRGQIDLDRDVNDYLTAFTVENDFDQPVTMRDLLQHTGGFDLRNTSRRTLDPDEFRPLEEYLADRLPPVVRRPGQVLVYSNHGLALAGYLIEAVTGTPFERYMVDSLFRPLGMFRSSFVRDDLQTANFAQGYFYRNGRYQEAPFEYTQTIPSSMLMSTAADVARYLRMHLNGGELDGRQILDSTMIRAMHQRQSANHDSLNGMCFGFYETSYNGHRILTHGGGFDGFHAQLYLWPEADLGWFMAVNRLRGVSARHATVQGFFDRFFPAEDTVVDTPVARHISDGINRFTGLYYSAGGLAQSSTEKLNMMIGYQFELTAPSDDTLLFDGYPFVRIDTLLFHDVSGPDVMAFMRGTDGEIAYMSDGLFRVFQKLAWYDNVTLHQIALGVCCGMFVLATVVWIVGWLGRKRGERLTLDPDVRRARILVSIAGLIHVIFLTGMFVVPTPNRYGVPWEFTALLWLPLLAVIPTLALPFAAVAVWRSDSVGIANKVFYTVVVVCAFFIYAIWHYWNLIGFNN